MGALQRANRAAFVPFITAGDPDLETSFAILQQLPDAGADIIELGVPFSDPMADGPAIQASSSRALRSGMTMDGVLDMVRRFRRIDDVTPVVLMGYFNPIHAYGVQRFVDEVAAAGADGVITVDLPPEEDEALRSAASRKELDIIRLATPTTDERRLGAILNGASGFLYYVSIAGVTGTKSYAEADVRAAVARLKRDSRLPCAVGFGIKTLQQACAVARFADAVVVGSAIIDRIAEAEHGKSTAMVDVLEFCRSLADAVHAARDATVVG